MAVATSVLGTGASGGCPEQITGTQGQVLTIDASGCVVFADAAAGGGSTSSVTGPSAAGVYVHNDGAGTNFNIATGNVTDNGNGSFTVVDANGDTINTAWYCPTDGGEVAVGGKIAIASEADGCSPQVLRDPVCNEVLGFDPAGSGRAGWRQYGALVVPVAATVDQNRALTHGDTSTAQTITTPLFSYTNTSNCNVLASLRATRGITFNIVDNPAFADGDVFNITYNVGLEADVAAITGFTNVNITQSMTGRVIQAELQAVLPGNQNGIFMGIQGSRADHTVLLAPGQTVNWTTYFRKTVNINTQSLQAVVRDVTVQCELVVWEAQ